MKERASYQENLRFTQMESFRKHLSRPLRLYLLAVPEAAERAEAMREVLSVWPQVEPQRVSSFAELSEALSSPSLWGGEPVIVAEGVEKWGKKEAQFPDYGYVLLLAAGKAAAVSALVEKRGAVLDLTEEKPWDRERRLNGWLQERAERGGKRLTPDAAALLLAEGERDLALFEQELIKLISYVGDRPTIEKEDVRKIAILGRTSKIWALAEELVWEQKMREVPEALVPFLMSVRTQLEMGQKLVALQSAPPESIKPFFPKVWPKTLEKRTAQAGHLGMAYFTRALSALYRVELLSRSGATSEEALLTYLHTSLYAALPSPQRST